MTRRQEAYSLFELAYRAQQRGQFTRAASLYKASIRRERTAEALTGLAWVYAHHGSLQRAVLLCRRAIKTDPELGNPYSDLGAYLIQLNRFKEAMRWFRRASRARRYAGLGGVFLNLGWLHESLGEETKALEAYSLALADFPDCPMARDAWLRICSRRN